MAERPLLILPVAENVSRPKLHGGGSRPLTPDKSAQIGRFAPTFARLKTAFEQGSDRVLELRNDPTALAPERVVVFEIAGTVPDFLRAAARIPGLEVMLEQEVEREPDELFAVKDTRVDRVGQRREDRLVEGRFYLAMPNVSALAELLRLWSTWESKEELPAGFAPFKHVFAQLRALRPWGPDDRIPAETIKYWQDEAAKHPDRPVRTEVELWFYASDSQRAKGLQDFRAAVSAAGGSIVHEATIPEIAYQGALIDIPIGGIDQLIERQNVALAICDDVMFLRPQTLISTVSDVDHVADGAPLGASESVHGQPIAALLDGVPLQGHDLLRGRLVLDDPEDLQSGTVVERRKHGTAMSSLILHGDRNAPENPLNRPLYVRPILVAPDHESLGEHSDASRLLIDTLYQAIVRLKGANPAHQTGVAPAVFLVNLSICDARRPFANSVSPLGRLLDFLAAKYDILFVVSAGNITGELEITEFSTWTDFERARPELRERAVLSALFRAKHLRSLLSPAESINAITVGAQHADNVAERTVGHIAVDPFADSALPNASCALGLGYRRGVKPDLYLPGGREYVRMASSGAGVRLAFPPPQRLFGIAAATPDRALGRLNQTAYFSGTSAATALATRAAHLIFDSLMDRGGGSLLADIPSAFYAVVVKTLLVHSAGWGSGELLKEICGPAESRRHAERSENATRFLGFGVPDVRRVFDCAENQATLVGYGTLHPEEAHNYKVPVPRSLTGVTESRELVITLGWFTPVKAGHQSYRCVKLEAEPGNAKAALGVSRYREQPGDSSVKKGSIFHERLSGERAVPYIEDGWLSFRVWCMDDAGNDGEPVRYGIAVTLKTAASLRIYDEVRERLTVRPRPQS